MPSFSIWDSTTTGAPGAAVVVATASREYWLSTAGRALVTDVTVKKYRVVLLQALDGVIVGLHRALVDADIFAAALLAEIDVVTAEVQRVRSRSNEG
jgi:hypothetical protein